MQDCATTFRAIEPHEANIHVCGTVQDRVERRFHALQSRARVAIVGAVHGTGGVQHEHDIRIGIGVSIHLAEEHFRIIYENCRKSAECSEYSAQEKSCQGAASNP